MEEHKSILEVLITCFGEEFPAIAKMRGMKFIKKFGIPPYTEARKITLEHTYKISQYVKDDHRNVLEAIVIELGMINKK